MLLCGSRQSLETIWKLLVKSFCFKCFPSFVSLSSITFVSPFIFSTKKDTKVSCDALSDAVQGALMSSHAWLTVSHSYAHDIVQDPAAGCGLRDLLNTRSVRYAPL